MSTTVTASQKQKLTKTKKNTQLEDKYLQKLKRVKNKSKNKEICGYKTCNNEEQNELKMKVQNKDMYG